MRAFIIACILATLGAAQSTADIAPCAQICVNSAYQTHSDGCSDADTVCLCSSSEYVEAVRDCLTETCLSSDATVAGNELIAQCHGVGVFASTGVFASVTTFPASSSSTTAPAAASTTGATRASTTSTTGAPEVASNPTSGTTPAAAASAGQPPSSRLSTGAIVGIVVGIVGALLAGILLAVIVLRCRRRPGTQGMGGALPPVQHQHQQHQQYQQQTGPFGVTMGGVTPLSPHNLDEHLAGQEWAGMKRDVLQKQTAYHSAAEETHVMPEDNTRDTVSRSGMTNMPELRPQDAPSEAAYADNMSAMYSADARTALYPASETVWHPRV